MKPGEPVREATLADVPAIARVHVDAWVATYRGLISEADLHCYSYADREAMWTEALTERAPSRNLRTSLFVAEHEGAIVGFAACGPYRGDQAEYDGELYAIYLDASHQGRGLGRTLFERVRARMRERRFKKFVLWVLDGNDAAVAFYERLGGTRASTGTFELTGETLTEHAYVFDLRTY